jgi:transketolase
MATDDFALMRSIPNMTIVSPSDAEEMKLVMTASLDYPGPIYVRLGKGGDPIIHNAGDEFNFGSAVPKTGPAGILIVSTGVMTGHCLAARDIIGEQGLDCAVLHFPTVKPLDEARLIEYAKSARLVVSVEEHSLIGGLGSAILESLNEHADTRALPMLRLGLPDRFSKIYGSQAEQLDFLELDAGGIAARVAAYVTANQLS